MCVFVLFAVCVNGSLWTDFQINGMEWNLGSWSIAGFNVFRISWAKHSISTRFSWSVTEILWPCYLLQCPHTE